MGDGIGGGQAWHLERKSREMGRSLRVMTSMGKKWGEVVGWINGGDDCGAAAEESPDLRRRWSRSKGKRPY